MTSRQLSDEEAALLRFGYKSAVVISLILLLICGLYLGWHAFSTDARAALESSLRPGANINQIDVAVSSYIAMSRISLHACGVLAGVAFLFLGFGLFLMGIQGTSNLSLDSNATKFSATQLAPGAFFAVCGAILIGLCATHSIEFEIQRDPTQIVTPIADSQPKAKAGPFVDAGSSDSGVPETLGGK